MGRIFLASTGLLLAACYSSVGTSTDAGSDPDAAAETEAWQEADQGCPAGLAECSGRCVDLASDAANCGACSNTCGLGSECRDGICRYPCEATCSSTRECCDDVCVDLRSDHDNCGGCWIECPEGSICRDGRCAVETCPIPCPVGYTCCIDACVDTSSDLRNCGACGAACDEMRADGCFAGNCSCRGALECSEDSMCCPGLGCRRILTDPSNCGGCGTACDLGETCIDGRCMCGEGMACRAGESCCSGRCIDTSTDPLNCGVCDVACDEQGPDCVGGQCMCGGNPACPWNDGSTACRDLVLEEFQICCDGACIQVGDGNCGECGLACEPETHCQGAYMFTCQFFCGG